MYLVPLDDAASVLTGSIFPAAADDGHFEQAILELAACSDG